MIPSFTSNVRKDISAKGLQSMLNVVCLKWGIKYPPYYVNRLYNMVKNNLSLPFRFYCMTEDSEGLDPEIEILSLPDLGIKGWWYKLYLFKPDFYGLEGEMLYLDLDIVITGNIDALIEYEKGAFCIASDRLEGVYNSSVLRFKIGGYAFIWDAFVAQKEKVIASLYGDQDWIQRIYLDAKIFPKKWVKSYKYDCHSKSPFNAGKIGEFLRSKGLFLLKGKTPFPEGTKIILFHGKPDPEDVIDGPYEKYYQAPWLKQYWIQPQ